MPRDKQYMFTVGSTTTGAYIQGTKSALGGSYTINTSGNVTTATHTCVTGFSSIGGGFQ